MTASSGDSALRRLYTDEWAWRTGELGHGSWRSTETDPFLPDVGPAAQERRQRRWEETLAAVREIDPATLSEAERTNQAVYANQLQTLINQQRFRTWEAPANADSSFWNDLIDRGRRPITDPDQADRWLSQLEHVPAYLEQQIENLGAGLARGFGPPKITMTGRETTARTVAEATDPAALPFVTTLDGVTGSRAESLRRQAIRLVEERVQPAFRGLVDYLTESYLPNLPESIAAVEIAGADYYAAQLREYTTLDLTPEEIHAIGLREVDKIRTEMRAIAEQTGFGGDVDALLAFMRSDDQFYVDEPRELLREAAWHAKKFDAVVHRYFGRVPRQRFAIIEVPPDLAPFYTFGRGGVDRYLLNTYGLRERPLYSLPALTLHEAAPGHAFQIPLALEQQDHPEFRRNDYLSAYGEGWALYTERLGVEMGMYETPYELMGMLGYQMWRAVRLVIDPGIHALGWSRERAQAFLRDNTAIGGHEVITEVDRYTAWPGQACAYYLGQLEILELRARAERELGEGFDLRNFHDQVLSLGSVPLQVLRAEIERFIARGGTSPYPASGLTQ
ncbi:DUF885 domain-containing protein [Microlunatus parietis]|uniref:Uncharacterized protein (DUF885 family) n=1 Tax=Microlunatus parietis TaxID=682979 RepID=A0A7Y9I354_9ACTN|nr:DUF885 family protein [Microlunatus parietis]NYE69356.1 uncharacterized protein (DUF885 family) [Microlunatus parietis]